MTYGETLDYLYSLERFGIKFGLENISHTLNLLNNPHQNFKAIHIAGTNGKGSTAAMIASILQYAGYKTALYTSPHLQDFRERIMVNGVMISEEDVVELTERIYDLRFTSYDFNASNRKSVPLTFFEFTTAMAFLYFAEEMVDFAVVEVGMGGRLDATNVLNPLLSVITEIDIEHTEHLGKDIRAIAAEKGGIIKDNGAVILSSYKTDVVEVIEAICDKKGAKLYRIERDFRFTIYDFGAPTKVGRTILNPKFQYFDFKGKYHIFNRLEIPLLGKYQIANASTAVMAAWLLTEKGFTTGEAAVREGLKNLRWNGRLEIVSENPLIMLDGAHNPAAAKVLTEELKKLKSRESRVRRGLDYRLPTTDSRLILIIGILKDKDYRGIIGFLAQAADYVIISKPKTPRSRDAADLRTEFLKYTNKVEIIEDISDAVSKAESIAGIDDLICITGSFFTVGEARGIVCRSQ